MSAETIVNPLGTRPHDSHRIPQLPDGINGNIVVPEADGRFLSGLRHHAMIARMKANIAIVFVGYLLTVGVTLFWVFRARQKRIPHSVRTVVCISLRTLPLFLLFFVVCQRLEMNALVAVGLLTVALWVLLISPSVLGMGTIGVLYVIQQWILGWPDRADFVLEPPLPHQIERAPSDEFIGRRVVAACPLRPGGIIVLDGTEYPVRSDLGYIDRGEEVIVVARKGMCFLVKPAGTQQDPDFPRKAEAT